MYGRIFACSLAVALGVAQSGARAAGEAAASPSNVGGLAVGSVAPAFTAHRLSDGSAVTNADYAGKILVLNFWATWCPPCRAETPGMIAAYHEYGAGDVAFLGVDTTEVPSVIKTFVSAKGLPYPIALAGPETYNAFGVAYIPTTVVIDAKGVVRALWTGELDPKHLGDFVADARAGKNFTFDTPDQTLVDRVLDPAGYPLGTTPEEYAAAAARIASNVAAVDAFENDHAVGKNVTVDFIRTVAEEGTLELAGAERAQALAKTPQEHVAADLSAYGADSKLDRYADAVSVLEDAQKLDPSNATLSLDIAKADYRLHDYAAGVSAAQAYVNAAPADSDGWDSLGLLEQRMRNFSAAAPAYEKAVALLEAQVPSAKSRAAREDADANVADEALDLANVYVALGDVAGTERAFATANRYGDRLDPHGEYADLYNNVHERTQEGSIAVRLSHGGKTALSVVPWTGPDLPGSVASTLKYRLIVASAPNGKVDLRALGLRPGWVASFCADGLCSPNRVSFEVGDSGVKTYEFQLVPPGASRAPGTVTIVTSDGIRAIVPARA